MSENSLILVLLKTQIKNILHMAKVNIKSEKITPFGGIYVSVSAMLVDTRQKKYRSSFYS